MVVLWSPYWPPFGRRPVVRRKPLNIRIYLFDLPPLLYACSALKSQVGSANRKLSSALWPLKSFTWFLTSAANLLNVQSCNDEFVVVDAPLCLHLIVIFKVVDVVEEVHNLKMITPLVQPANLVAHLHTWNPHRPYHLQPSCIFPMPARFGPAWRGCCLRLWFLSQVTRLICRCQLVPTSFRSWPRWT